MKEACNVSDIIFDTAKRLGITEKALFRRVAAHKHLTEATADDRYERWFKKGEVPDYVMDFCLDQYREPFPLPHDEYSAQEGGGHRSL